MIEETTGKMKPPEEEAGLISSPLLGCQHRRDPVSDSRRPRGRLCAGIITSGRPPSHCETRKRRSKEGRRWGGGRLWHPGHSEMAVPPLQLRRDPVPSRARPRGFHSFTAPPPSEPSFYKHLRKDAGITKGRQSLSPRPRPSGLTALAGQPSAPNSS